MKKVKVATVWLDGCSGCHMSLLDMDAAIISLGRKIDLVYGPLVDAQEFPEDVDVTLVEGAVSSQDDLNKIQKIRQRTGILISLGDCAVTGNVPALRNSIPVPKLLQRVYIEGLNMIKRHQKPRQVAGAQRAEQVGGVIEKEGPIHLSNVMLLDPKDGKPTRVGIEVEEGKRHRIARRSGARLD